MTFPMYQNKLEFLMTFLFSIALSVAFIGYSKYTYIDIRPFADVLIAIILTIAAARNKTFIRLNAYLFIYLVFILYIIISIFLNFKFSYFSHYLITLKQILYVSIFIFASQTIIKCIRLRYLLSLYQILLLFALTKYSVSLVFELNDRPLLFTENNFEIPFFAILYCFLLPSFHKPSREFLLIVLLVALSGSSSGLLVLIFVTIITFEKHLDAFRIIIISPVIITLIGVGLFAKFSNGLEAIDRFHYLLAAFETLSVRDGIGIAFGYIGPLEKESCDALNYMSGKFADDGSCFSNIVYIGIIRTIIDYGVIGSLLLYFSLYRALRNNHSGGLCFAIIAITAMNGLSVSGLYNNMIALSILLTLLVGGNEVPKFNGKSAPNTATL